MDPIFKSINLSKTFFLVIVFSSTVFPQNWGMSLGASTEATVYGDIFYNKYNHYFHFGVTYQFSDAKGEEKYVRESNYGLTTSGTGDKFYTFEIGYGYEIIDTFIVFVELSFGERKYFTNYVDNRFKDGGYHLITKNESITGYGIGGSYKISRQFMIFISYNTLRKLGAGARYLFNFY